MQHILQFAIDIDDNRIQETVYKQAEQQVVKECAQEFKKIIYNSDRWGQRGVSEWTKERFAEFLVQHRDEIITKAAENLTERLIRTKIVREAAGKAAADALGVTE